MLAGWLRLRRKTDSLGPIAASAIEKRIFVVRGRQVMLDEDLADLYGVETRRLIEQVKRNRDRFPEDFMFQLSKEEAAVLRSQIAISNGGSGGRRYAPYVFTEQGVAMLSGVLKSKRAVAVNIAIMRAFVELRRAAVDYAALEKRLDRLERDTSSKLGQHDEQLDQVFKALRQLIAPPVRPKRAIGFRVPEGRVAASPCSVRMQAAAPRFKYRQPPLSSPRGEPNLRAASGLRPRVRADAARGSVVLPGGG